MVRDMRTIFLYLNFRKQGKMRMKKIADWPWLHRLRRLDFPAENLLPGN